MNAAVRRDLRLMLLAAAISGACFAAALSVVTLGFESNDDVGMAQIASGLNTGAPSAELIFSNILIGRVIKFLYQLTTRVNWYTLYLLATHFLALTGLLWAFLRMLPTRLAVMLFGLLFVEFEIALLLRLQFTSTAILAAVSGIILILSRDEAGGSRSSIAGRISIASPISIASLCGGGLLVLAGLIRPDAMYYALLLLAPLLIYEAVRFRPWRSFAVIGVSVAVVMGGAALDAWHYRSDPAWREFMAYNRVRAAIHDLPIVKYEDNTRFFFNRIGWSYTDWGMFTNWFFTDPDTYSRERLESVLARFQESNWGRARSDQYLSESLRPIPNLTRLVFLNLVLAVVLAAGSRFRVLLIVAGQYVMLQLVLMLLAWYAKLPLRVILPAYLGCVAAGFYVVLREASLRRHLLPLPWSYPRLRPVAQVAALAFALYYARPFYFVALGSAAKSDYNHRDQQVFELFVQTLHDRYTQRDSQAIFFNWGGRFPMFFTPPLDNYQNLRDLRMLGLGWNIHSPQFDAEVSRLGLDDLYQATYSNPHVYLFAVPMYLKQLQRYVQEHYHRRISPKRADHLLADSDRPPDYFAADFSVYQMGPKANAADPRDSSETESPPCENSDDANPATPAAPLNGPVAPVLTQPRR
jgi:hypothetical protein